LAAYSSALENVPGDKKASSSNSGALLNDSDILVSGMTVVTGSSMMGGSM
jgi:hypothetical protein